MKLKKFWSVGGPRAGVPPLNPPLQTNIQTESYVNDLLGLTKLAQSERHLSVSLEVLDFILTGGKFYP